MEAKNLYTCGYILTGTPGSGKTMILRALERMGYSVVEEAATDIIALDQALGTQEPWHHPKFIDDIIQLQHQREKAALPGSFFDRSIFCTYALAKYLSFEPSSKLMTEVERILRERVYDNKVLFLENLGFIKPTEARRITLEEALRFEDYHRQAYSEFGFNIINIPPLPIIERANFILNQVRQ